MQQLKIKILPGMGESDGKWETVEFGTLITRYSPSLALYINTTKQFPLFHILNEELNSGGKDQEMSCACFWKPFELTKEVYSELKEEMLTSNEFNLEYDESLEDRKTLKSLNYT